MSQMIDTTVKLIKLKLFFARVYTTIVAISTLENNTLLCCRCQFNGIFFIIPYEWCHHVYEACLLIFQLYPTINLMNRCFKFQHRIENSRVNLSIYMCEDNITKAKTKIMFAQQKHDKYVCWKSLSHLY